MKRAWLQPLLVACLGAPAGCADEAPSTPRLVTASPRAGTDATEQPAGGKPITPRLCPANNLTQTCICDDGASGRQICIESRGWGPCDCGQLAAMEVVNEELRSAPSDPPANRNVGITFDDFVMPRSTDGCEPGRYLGTFQCSYQQGMMGPTFEASGIVSFALERSSNSEVLEIRDGLLDGWGGAFFFGYLNGELTCLDGAFSGSVSDGFYNFLLKGCSGMDNDMPGVNCVITDPDDPDYVPWNVTLEGTYEGTLDTSAGTIDGSWSLQPLDIGGTCDGTFTVELTP